MLSIVESKEEDANDYDYRSVIQSLISKFVSDSNTLFLFVTHGDIDENIGLPAVEIKNVGRLGYPLCSQQAKAIVDIATLAPFGKGSKTVIDLDVRKAWQVDPEMVTIREQWKAKSLPRLVTEVCKALGVDDDRLKVEAHFYKLLLYEAGGHFKKHQDTEKEQGMFGSLLIQLPAEYEGGDLVVAHNRKQIRIACADDSANRCCYSAFYSDCEHTLEPVKAGLRLVLAFNLVRTASNVALCPKPLPPNEYGNQIVMATRKWTEDKHQTEKFVRPLQHQYTDKNISFSGLKGDDKKLVDILMGLKDEDFQPLYSVYLACVTKTVTGQGEDDYGHDGYTLRESDPEVETEVNTDRWIGPNGFEDFGGLSVDMEDEFLGERIMHLTHVFICPLSLVKRFTACI